MKPTNFDPAEWLDRFTAAGGWYLLAGNGLHLGWPVPDVWRAMATREIYREIEDPKQPEPPRLARSPRCLARTRLGTACRSPDMNGNRRCRMHGGKGSGAPKGNRIAYKHGGRSAETSAVLAMMRDLGRMLDDS